MIVARFRSSREAQLEAGGWPAWNACSLLRAILGHDVGGNVEVVRRIADALNRRDVDAIVEELDPDIEWHLAMQAFAAGRADR